MGNELQAILEPRPQKAPVDSGFWRNVFTNPEMPEKALISHVQYMLENNVDVASNDEEGIVPLVRVIRWKSTDHSRIKFVMMLLTAGVDVTLRNKISVAPEIRRASIFPFNACETALLNDKNTLENVLACKDHFDLKTDFVWVTRFQFYFRFKCVDSTFKIDLLIIAL